MTLRLDSKVPSGPIEKKWDKRIFEAKLVNPANKRKFEIIVVGNRPDQRPCEGRLAGSRRTDEHDKRRIGDGDRVGALHARMMHPKLVRGSVLHEGWA